MTRNVDRIGRVLAVLEAAVRVAPEDGGGPSVAELAAEVGLSAYHVHRMFTAMVGRPPGDYLRRRRLTEAARRLVDDPARPIVQVAFDAGFGSQEAFTRAFERMHGTTPGAFRRAGRGPTVTQPALDTDTLEHLMQNVTREPEIVEFPRTHVVGMARRYPTDAPNDIPQLWMQFGPRVAEVPGALPVRSFGVCLCDDRLGTEPPSGDGPAFTYMAAVAVPEPLARSALPDGMSQDVLAAGRYLRFTHRGPIARIRETMDFIWGTWLPRSEYEVAGTPDFEFYDARFDPMRDDSEMDVYVPIR